MSGFALKTDLLLPLSLFLGHASIPISKEILVAKNLPFRFPGGIEQKIGSCYDFAALQFLKLSDSTGIVCRSPFVYFILAFLPLPAPTLPLAVHTTLYIFR